MEEKNSGKMYGRFYIMLLCSYIIMYVVMYANIELPDHIDVSLSRIYMTILMVTPMAIIMLLMMSSMFKNRKQNIIIISASIIMFIAAFIFLRTQMLVGDLNYMKGMIPHHSSAILFSKKAAITDPEVKKLSLEIISSQEEEIARMKKMIERLSSEK